MGHRPTVTRFRFVVVCRFSCAAHMAKRGIKNHALWPYEASWTRSIQMITKGHVMGMKTPYEVVQLRQDNAAASLCNIVGFQNSHLKWGEQNGSSK